jgi:hypothetical protein
MFIFLDVQQVDKYFEYAERSYAFSEQNESSEYLMGRSACQHVYSRKVFDLFQLILV